MLLIVTSSFILWDLAITFTAGFVIGNLVYRDYIRRKLANIDTVTRQAFVAHLQK